MSVISALGKTISQPPSKIQVAINGMWEDTWQISYASGMPTESAIDDYLHNGTEALAFELFFTSDDSYDIVLGIRRTEGLVPLTPRDFLISSFHSIWSVQPPSFVSFIRRLSATLTGDEGQLFRRDPTGVELGVINWWKSLGSVEVWQTGQQKTLSKEKLNKKLADFPHVLKNDKNYVAMEFNYRRHPHYWIGIQVSDKQNDQWILNNKRLYEALQMVDIDVQART